MRSSVIISCYEQSRELDIALAALARQTRLPSEVLIADDGSGPQVKAVVSDWAQRVPFPIQHVWQEDRGYRKSRILNEAVRRSTGDQLIFLDGDSFPHRSWVHDHMSSANGVRILCGRRVKLGPELSPQVSRADVESGRFDSPFRSTLIQSMLRGDTKRLGLALRLPKPAVRLVHPRPRKLMGVNWSTPRSAYLQVNGLDEDWTVYGHEDRDIELRLIRAGIPRAPLINRAIVFHLYHAEREKSAKTLELLAAAEASTATRCEHGVEQEGPFDPAG